MTENTVPKREICIQVDHDHEQHLDFDDITLIFRRFVRKKRTILIRMLVIVPLIAGMLLLAIYSESSHFGNNSKNIFSENEKTADEEVIFVDSSHVDKSGSNEFQSAPLSGLQNNSISNITTDDDWISFSQNSSAVSITDIALGKGAVTLPITDKNLVPRNNSTVNITDVAVGVVAVNLSITNKYVRFLDLFISAEDWQLLQTIRDYWSQAGKWVAGDNDVRYDMTFPVPYLVSYGCEHYELEKATVPTYKWVVENIPGRNFPPFPTQYSKQRLCSVLGGQRILLVGDSLQEHFYFYFGLIGTQNMDLVSNAMIQHSVVTINCTEHDFLPIELFFTRSDRLFIDGVSYEEATSYTNYVDHPFIHLVQEHDISLLLLNRGAHYVNDINFVRNLDQLFQYLVKTYENVSIVFRNTSPGHPDCNDQLYSPPLSEPPDLEKNRGSHDFDSAHRYHWSEFVHQNSLVQTLIAKQYPSIILLDIATPTILRADHHVGGDDCLHYCCHSVVDHWLLLFINAMEQVQLVGKIGLEQ